MNSFELNKIFAAVLVAGITAMMGGFIADVLIHPQKLEQDAVAIEGAPVAAGAAGAVAMPEPIAHLIANADVAQGEKLSKACLACHSFEQGGPTKIGPNLYGVIGGPKAHIAGFAYSAAMKEAGGTWTYRDLNKFLWKPKDFLSGTTMNYIGIRKPEDRAALIAWLRTQGSSGVALPSDAEIQAEAAELAPPEPEVEETTEEEAAAAE